MAVLSIANTLIRRPVLATVLSLLMLLVGAIALPRLPIEQLPELAPVQLQVTAQYPGADAETVEKTVTTILEREINGVEGIDYISSNSTSTGESTIKVVFLPGQDRNAAQVNLQNKVAIAQPQLPPQVNQLGVTVTAQSPSALLVYRFYSEDDRYDPLFLHNYVDLLILDEIKRIAGVGSARIFGAGKYAMRLWLNPSALARQGLTPEEVVAALKEQNIQIGGGALGAPPSQANQSYQLTVRLPNRLSAPQQFEEVVLKVAANGQLVRFKDVGRVELGSENYSLDVKTDQHPAAGLLVYQLPGSNALQVATAIRNRMAALQPDFPPGFRAEIVFDTTEFVRVSLQELLVTLALAIALVLLMLFIFLQDWHATLIPAIAIPVSLIGSLGFLLAFGFSINTLTLFGLILATGLVVDDAIIVVEAIASKITQGMRPRLAALDAMAELSGAVLSTSLVLMAVFIPVAFFPGTSGQIYQQFALTIVFTVLISTVNALSFSPAMAALLLRPVALTSAPGPLGRLFRGFNHTLRRVILAYGQTLRRVMRWRYGVVGLFIAGVALMGLMLKLVPGGFVPAEDQGYLIGVVQAPDGVSLAYTQAVMARSQAILAEFPEIKSTFLISGFSFDGAAPNRGVFFATLTPWHQRPGARASVFGLLPRLNQALATLQQARVVAFNAAPVPGFSPTNGLEMQLQDRSGGQLSLEEFFKNSQEIMAVANQSPAADGVFSSFSASTPQIQVDFDRDRLKTLGIDLAAAQSTLGTYLGSQYINDFSFGGRNYRVLLQADAPFRNDPEDIGTIYLRSRDGTLVSMAALSSQKEITGPATISHFNLVRSIKVEGQPAPSASSGQLIRAMTAAYDQAALPSVGLAWQGSAREELAAGGAAAVLFGLGLGVVFLVLAAQYESYIDPIIILLAVPLAVLGALVVLWLRGLTLNIYAQVGLVMLIGLASKNAILIVEFANQARGQGLGLVPAAINASQQRFRPIIMTSIASLAGFFPLLTATGAGSASRWAVGYTVFGGLLVATLLSLLVVPVFYVLLKGMVERCWPSANPAVENQPQPDQQ